MLKCLFLRNDGMSIFRCGLRFVNRVYGCMVLCALLGLAFVKYPGNHGMSSYAFLPLFLVGVLLVLVECAQCRRWSPVKKAWASLLGIVLVVGFDRFNIMLSYEEWTSRGMPEFGSYDYRPRVIDVVFDHKGMAFVGRRKFVLSDPRLAYQLRYTYRNACVITLCQIERATVREVVNLINYKAADVPYWERVAPARFWLRDRRGGRHPLKICQSRLYDETGTPCVVSCDDLSMAGSAVLDIVEKEIPDVDDKTEVVIILSVEI